MNQSPENQENTPKNTHQKLKIGILLVIAVLLLGILLSLRGCQSGDAPAAASAAALERERLAETGILPGMTAEEIQGRLNTIVDEGMFNVSMNPKVTFANGKAKGDVRIENIEANRYSCTVEIFLKDTEDSILKTGLIDPGQFVEKMPLSRALDAGGYDCTAVFTAYNSESLEEVGKVEMQIVVLVDA